MRPAIFRIRSGHVMKTLILLAEIGKEFSFCCSCKSVANLFLLLSNGRGRGTLLSFYDIKKPLTSWNHVSQDLCTLLPFFLYEWNLLFLYSFETIYSHEKFWRLNWFGRMQESGETGNSNIQSLMLSRISSIFLKHISFLLARYGTMVLFASHYLSRNHHDSFIKTGIFTNSFCKLTVAYILISSA